MTDGEKCQIKRLKYQKEINDLIINIRLELSTAVLLLAEMNDIKICDKKQEMPKCGYCEKNRNEKRNNKKRSPLPKKL
jgi:hypothetical protein